MSDTFVEFTPARKSMIVFCKARLTDRENLRREANEYGNRAKKLFLLDYAVYASVRGADFRKASHLEDGSNAEIELKNLLSFLIKFKENTNRPLPTMLSRFAPDSTCLDELEACLKASLGLLKVC